jgi:uncharacterized membrane protein YdjX (TVP38/TMEM64 family)
MIIIKNLLLLIVIHNATSFRHSNSNKLLSSTSSLLSLSLSKSNRNRNSNSNYRLLDTNTRIDIDNKKLINKKDNNNNDNNDNNNDIGNFEKKSIAIIAIIGIISIAYGIVSGNLNFIDIIESTVDKVADLGPLGYLYFSAVYIIAEILAIPAFPLTASSGYLFGLVPGTLIVLISATIAATISFYIGRTFLKDWAYNFTSKWSQWEIIDKAIAKEGFKVILLLRLSPLLPFALSNYLYGITSIDFPSFIAGTFLGFAPGTFALVYTGTAGKDLLSEAGENLPWYAYAIVGSIILLVGKVIAQIATKAIKELEEKQ